MILYKSFRIELKTQKNGLKIDFQGNKKIKKEKKKKNKKRSKKTKKRKKERKCILD